MKQMKYALLIIIGLFMYACEGEKVTQKVEAKSETVNISGKVQGGYRHLTLDIKGTPAALTIYRGDYVKFIINDEGDPQSDYPLIIPELEINVIVSDTAFALPYYKMKIPGEYEFSIGEQTGVIKVVELRQANYTELTNAEAMQLLTEDEAPFLLDVRTKMEFNRGYIEGADLIPLQEIQRRVGELEKYKNHPIIIYCATGNRSTTASKILLDRGFKNVMNLRRGIADWARNGYLVVR